MKKVTVKMLDKLDACEEDVSLFIMYFGKEAEVTLENCLICAKLGLDLDWFARRVLSSPAWAKYMESIAPASAKYDEATALARAEYYEAKAQAWAKYEEAMAPARYKALTKGKE